MMSKMSFWTAAAVSFSKSYWISFFWTRKTGGRPACRWMSVAFFSIAMWRMRSMSRTVALLDPAGMAVTA